MQCRHFATLMAAILAVGGLWPAGIAADEAAEVGLLVALSGANASAGIDLRDGFRLTLDLSGTDHIDLQIADVGGSPETAASAARAMSASAKLIIGPQDPHQRAAAARALDELEARHLPLAQPRACTPRPMPVSWTISSTPEALGSLANRADYRFAFLLAEESQNGLEALAGFKREYAGSIAGELYISPAETDFSAAIAQIRASGADSVIHFLPGPSDEPFLRHITESGVGLPVLGPETVRAVLPKGSAGGSTRKDPETAFREAYRAAYGRAPSIAAQKGFATASRLIDLLPDTGAVDPERIAAAWSKAAREAAAEQRGWALLAQGAHPMLAPQPPRPCRY